MDKPLHTVALTRGFLSQAKAEGMTQAEMGDLVQALAANPEMGDLIQGSGGCRKVRLAGKGHGKSGGYRAVTFFAHAELPVYVFAVLSKGARENFSDAEVEAMNKAAKAILSAAKLRAAG
jgi:hypothetical protein